MVVYARDRRDSSESEIAEGVTVRERQQILSLPDLTRMQVKTQVHEAVLDQIQPGLPVTVRVDAFPNRRYVGLVEDVGVVPTSNGWGGTSVKTYDCIVRIPERVENLKPGMTAVVDIHADRIRNVMAVPVQAVFQIDKDHWCYVNNSETLEKRKVELGRSNDKFVHVQNGLALNDRVVLNPMSLWEATESSEPGIAPDAGMPDVPDVPVEKISENNPPAKQRSVNGDRPRPGTGGKGKRSRSPGGGKPKEVSEQPPTAAAAG
jgi:multidrug efflux pump subunit AcrA (membrane-fusion protein)